MNILDFTTSKRVYMLYSYLKGKHDYCFIPNYDKDIYDIERYCPDSLKSLISIDDVHSRHFNVIILHTCSILYRKSPDKLTHILNKFRGKIFCVDYAWEGALHKRVQSNFQLRKKISGMGIAIKKSATDIKPFAYSQPGLDIFARASHFVDKNQIIKSYGLPGDMMYMLVTAQPKSYSSPKKIKLFIRFVKKNIDLDNVCIIWKLKEDHMACYKIAKRFLKRNIPHYKIVFKQPHNENGVKVFRDFISPICELCVIADCHINISPLSYAQVETIRSGVPTYFFNKRGFSGVDYLDDLKQQMWTDDSFERYSVFKPEKSRCRLKVPNNYCTMNFIKHIEREMND